MTAPLVVPALRWVTVCVILGTALPVARERRPGAPSPKLEWTFPPLPPTIKAELERAKVDRDIIEDNRRHVALTREDAVALIGWCVDAAAKMLTQAPPNRLDV